MLMPRAYLTNSRRLTRISTRAILTAVCLLLLNEQVAQAAPNGAVAVPEGWTSNAGQQGPSRMHYAAGDGSVQVEISGHEPTDLPATAWLDARLSRLNRIVTVYELAPAARDPDILAHIDAAENADAAFSAVRWGFKDGSHQQNDVYGVVVRPGKSVQLAHVQILQRNERLGEYMDVVEQLLARSALGIQKSEDVLANALPGFDAEALANKVRETMAAEDTAAAKEKQQGTSASSQGTKASTASRAGRVDASQVAGVHYDWGRQVNRNMVSVQVDEGVYVFYKDGMAYLSSGGAPVDLDIAASRKAEPDRWMPWKQVPKYKPKLLMKPLPAGQRLNVLVIRNRAQSSGSTTFRNFRLYKDGSFETSFSSLLGGGLGSIGSPVQSSTSTTSNKSGDSSTTVGTSGRATVTRQSKRSPKGDRSGTYSIDGYTLTLDFDNGITERQLIATDLKETYVIGNVSYWNQGWYEKHRKKARQ